MPALFPFDNSFAAQMEGFYVPVKGHKVPRPHLLKFNAALATDLGLDVAALDTPLGGAIFAGAAVPDGADPLAQVYAGHQFGGFSPQLGDGRALLLGEVIDDTGTRRDIALKGSGKTPFSRGGDGKAVLGPILREYLLGEAMHALRVPTTRALAASTTGETILRQNGPEQGAVLARVAASHLRVGTFQFFASRGEIDKLRQLADYTIARHDPDLADAPDKYLQLLARVRTRQARLIAHWMTIGFVHGVMNTDNMTLSGETIDYGPCAFLDTYDPNAVFSSIDQNGRYAYANQPGIAQWNLARFAECLLDLINPEDSDDAIRQASNTLALFGSDYQTAWTDLMREKLGLLGAQDDDFALATDLLDAMTGQGVDYTNLFRALAEAALGNTAPARGLFINAEKFDAWLPKWIARAPQDKTAQAAHMNATNPLYIPRNHLVEAALFAANTGDMTPFDTLLDRLKSPFIAKDGAGDYAKPAPDSFGKYRTFCGT